MSVLGGGESSLYLDLDADHLLEPARAKQRCYYERLEEMLDQLHRDPSVNERVVTVEVHVDPLGWPSSPRSLLSLPAPNRFALAQTSRWWWSMEYRDHDSNGGSGGGGRGAGWVIQRARNYSCVQAWCQGVPRGSPSLWGLGSYRYPQAVDWRRVRCGPRIGELLSSLVREGALDTQRRPQVSSLSFANAVVSLCVSGGSPPRTVC